MEGTPGRLIELASEKEIGLYTSSVLVDEFSEVLHRSKLAKQVAATQLTAAQMLRNYRRLATLVTARSESPETPTMMRCCPVRWLHAPI